MSRIGKIARRSFLIGSAAVIGGGVASAITNTSNRPTIRCWTTSARGGRPR